MINPSSSQEIPLDTDPTISVNLSVKNTLKQGEKFHIDYPALRETLSAVGAPADSSSLSIEFGSKMSAGDSGGYNPGIEHARIVSRNNERLMQKSLQHELKHYADMAQNPVTQNELLRNNIGKSSIKASLAASGLGVLTLIGSAADSFPQSIWANHETLEAISNTSEVGRTIIFPIILGSAALAGVLYYGQDRERTARKAEKLKLPIVASKQSI
ncbi:MAG: hypothetical protein JWN28_908 [Candidatus Saccharibacteria bacterium]|nr:hypothetical protein [Candidatus Saccharibacteria bacterium]